MAAGGLLAIAALAGSVIYSHSAAANPSSDQQKTAIQPATPVAQPGAATGAVPTPPTSCEANLGEARAYGLSFLTGGKPSARSSISSVLTGGGLAPSPVGGVVELEPGKLVTFVIGSGKDGSRLEPERPPLNVPTTRTKIYWNSKSDS